MMFGAVDMEIDWDRQETNASEMNAYLKLVLFY